MSAQQESKTQSDSSPLWQKAVQRYQDELQENDDYEDVLELGSLEDLLNQGRTIEPTLPPERSSLGTLNQIGPKLKFVDDFAALIALYFGADAKLTALVWGSIRVMLKLASSTGEELLQDMLNMLEELNLTLPRLKTYKKTLPMNRKLEDSLVDVYTEVMCCYARAIHFFREHPHRLVHIRAWDDFHQDFTKTVNCIKRLSSVVEKEADLARMKVEEQRYKEVLGIMESLKDTKLDEKANQECYFIPSKLNPRFWGRDNALQAIGNALLPKAGSDSLQTFALYGMGGVGKTQIALQYANKNRALYNTILWVSADTSISMGQSFRDVAYHLELITTEEERKDTVAATLKVKEWLGKTSSNWLVVFDNADDLEILRQAWPRDPHGSILITTRDFNPARNPASTGFHVQTFDDETGSQLLLSLVGLQADVPANQEKAKAIANALGGLPLALSQVGGFISQRKLPLQDFLPLYEKHAAKIDAKNTGIIDYEHTLSTVWEMSLSTLSGDPLKLLNLLAFIEPDSVPEIILSEASKLLDGEEFEFLKDEMDLGDAEEVLLHAALINKNMRDTYLSIHRLVQASVIRRLDDDERSKHFNTIVQLLNWGFPNTWSKDIGHQVQAWTKCDMCLPHVNHDKFCVFSGQLTTSLRLFDLYVTRDQLAYCIIPGCGRENTADFKLL